MKPVERTPESLRLLGIAATTTAVVVWGAASVLVKGIEGLDGIGIAAYRLGLGAVLLVVAYLVTGGRIDGRLLRLCAPGGLAFAADLLFFYSAIRATSVANATVIGALQPVLLLPVGVWLFGERITRVVAGFSVVAVAGTAVVMFGAGGVPEWSLRGDLLACGALLSWTAYFVASKRARETLGALEYFTGLTIVAAAIVVPFALGIGADMSPAGAGDWVALAVMTIVSGALGHVLLNWSHAHVPLQLVSLLTLLVPVVATAGAVLFLDETLVGVQVGGMIIVLVALVEVVRRSATTPTLREEPLPDVAA